MKAKIAVIGCGEWGKHLIRNFFELGFLHSVCDNNLELANHFAKKFNTKCSTYDKILNDSSIKGIVLAVPAYLHYTLALDAFNKGKSVFVEKPIAMSVSETELMIASAKKNKVKLMVGHLMRYHPIFNKIKKIVDSGKIGEINYLYSNRLSFGRVRSNEDVIWSFAPHDISMVISLLNEQPEFVFTKASSMIQKNILDIASIHLDFKSGIKTKISISWLNPFKEVKLTIVGKKATIVFDDTKNWNEKLTIYSYDFSHKINFINRYLKHTSVEYIKVPQEEPLKIECQHFIDVIEKNIEPKTNGYEGLDVVKILTAASNSHKKNKKIKI